MQNIITKATFGPYPYTIKDALALQIIETWRTEQLCEQSRPFMTAVEKHRRSFVGTGSRAGMTLVSPEGGSPSGMGTEGEGEICGTTANQCRQYLRKRFTVVTQVLLSNSGVESKNRRSIL